jgi:hypothetical protein
VSNLALRPGGRYETVGADLASSEGTGVSSSSSANVKGTYVEITAATAFQYEAIFAQFSQESGTNRDFVFDIAIGASAEAIVVENLQLSTFTEDLTASIFIPVRIPSGARIAARCQCSTGNSTRDLHIIGVAGGPSFPAGYTKAVGLGVNLADSGGTPIDPGSSLNTKGAYVPLVASTAEAYVGLVPVIGGILNSARLTYEWLFDVSIGAATVERVVLPDLNLRSTTVVHIVLPQFFSPYPVYIPAGTRIAARAQCSGNDATDRLFDLSLMGLVA